MILEAETLDFVEIESGLLWSDLVDGNTSHWFVWSIVYLVEGKSCLACIYCQLSGLRLELPRNVVFSVAYKEHLVFAEYIDFIWAERVVFVGLGHGEAKSLADDIIEGYWEEVGSKQEENDSMNSIELTPFGFLFEHFVYLDGLTSFSDT